MKKLCLIFMLFSLFMITGCGSRNTANKTSSKLVTQIDIVYTKQDTTVSRSYTNPEKMEVILLYLRLLRPTGKPEADPELFYDDVYKITLRFLDGHERIYRQRANRFLSAGEKPWYTVNPEHAQVLYSIMQDMPGDTI